MLETGLDASFICASGVMIGTASASDLFDSAATGSFDEATSDLNFVIGFQDYGPAIANRFLELTTAIERLFGRSIDVVFDSDMKNPYFRAVISSLYYGKETATPRSPQTLAM